MKGTTEVLAIKEAKESGIHIKQQQRVSVPGRSETTTLDNLLQSDTDSLSEEGGPKHPNGEK